MCFRNGIAYSCPDGHMLLNTFEPFTLCDRADHYPIPRQCANVIDRYEKCNEWCDDCLIKLHASDKSAVGNDYSRYGGWGGGRGTYWGGNVPQ